MKHVFLVGCPRSGTTWLQILLAQHGQVATGRETHLFSGYLNQLDRRWRFFQSLPDRVGLKMLFSEDEYYSLCSVFVQGVMNKIAATNASATVVLEKTPNHVRFAPLILKVVPDAYFIHIVRDPRSVVSSLCAASRSWGKRWASSNVLSNARIWCSDVTLGHEISQLTERFREVRYEDLSGSQGADVLGRLYAWLGLPAGPELAAAALEACEITRLREGGKEVRAYESVKPQDSVFFRKGMTDGWKQELAPKDIEVIEYAAGALMHEYGYSPYRPTKGKRPFRVVVGDLIDRVESGVRRRTKTTFEKLRAVC